MPIVPKYDQPQVKEQAYSNLGVRGTLTKEDFGFGVGKALNDIADKSFDYAMREKSNADEVVVTEALTQLQDAKRNALYDPQKGLLGAKGKAALEAGDKILNDFDEKAKAIGDSLVNDTQRNAFNKLYLNQKTDLTDTAMKHTYVEAEAHDRSVSESAIKNFQSDALDNHNNPAKRDQALKLGSDMLTAYLIRSGKEGEVEEKQRDYFGQTTLSIVDKQVSAGDTRGAYQTAKEAEGRGLIHGDWNKKIGDLLKAGQKQDMEKLDVAASNHIEAGGTYNTIPDNIRLRLTVGQRSSLKSLEKGMREGGVETNLDAYMQYKSMAGNPRQRDQFINIPTSTLKATLAPAEQKEIANLIADARNGTVSKKTSNFLSDKELVERLVKNAGYDLGKDSGKAALNSILLNVDKKRNELMETTGKAPDQQEIQKIAEYNLIETKTNKTEDRPWFFNNTKKVYEMSPDERVSVPAEEKAKILESYRRVNPGKVPSSDEIQTRYEMMLMRTGGKK